MKDCLFCSIEDQRKVFENDLFFVIRDKFPVTELHSLIIPKRHIASYFDLNNDELNLVHEILKNQKGRMLEMDSSITGFNIGVNDGTDAGQTVMHCHIHLIPRRKGSYTR